MYPLLEQLGNPEKNLRIIQVAGTNGKGSVSYLTAGLLSKSTQGAVGLFTSPHLERLTERFQLVTDGKYREVDQADLDQALAKVAVAAEKLPAELGPLTEFEAWTATAALLFAQAGVTEAVFEVGLGGRLDATTALPAELAIITPIAYDHLDRLGTTLTCIAQEKAAIIRPGQKVVVAQQVPEVQVVIEAQAQQEQATLFLVDGYTGISYQPNGTLLAWRSQTGQSYQFTLGLLGQHQVANAAIALTAVEVWQGNAVIANDQSRAQLGQMLAEAVWPGRFELLRYQQQPVLLDVGHNPHGIRSFLENLNLYFPHTPKWGIFGGLRDKDYQTSLAYLAETSFQKLIFTEPWSERRVTVADLAAAYQGSQPVELEPDLLTALDRGLAGAAQDSALLVVFGSFFLIGPVRSRLKGAVPL